MLVKKKDVESEIFTGSMADISFLLIIYFMVTSVFSATRGLDFALPDESNQPPEIKQEDSIDVHVLGGEDLRIEVDGKGLPLEQLLPYVLERLQQNSEKPVILRTDPEGTYGNMITVFDELRRAREEWSDELGNPLQKDQAGKAFGEIATISIPAPDGPGPPRRSGDASREPSPTGQPGFLSTGFLVRGDPLVLARWQWTPGQPARGRPPVELPRSRERAGRPHHPAEWHVGALGARLHWLSIGRGSGERRRNPT